MHTKLACDRCMDRRTSDGGQCIVHTAAPLLDLVQLLNELFNFCSFLALDQLSGSKGAVYKIFEKSLNERSVWISMYAEIINFLFTI